MIRNLFVIAVSLLIYAGTSADTADIRETDHLNHTLTLARIPDNIACLYAFSGHVVTMLGRGEDMVAVVRGLKKDKLLNRILPGLKQLPVPAAGGIIHVEALLGTSPDIVFLKPETAVIPEETRKLEHFGIPYISTGYSDMAGQMAVIEMTGRILGREKKAREYTRYYRQIIQQVKKRTIDIPENRKVRLYHSINEPMRTDGPGTLEADWTAACNVINVSVGPGLKSKKNKRYAGMEQILAWNPETIIVNEANVVKIILTDPKWEPIRAVQTGQVYPIPVGISRWGHPGGLETPLAILWTAKTVYPARFQDVDLDTEIRNFYKRFFDLALPDSTINRILSGKGMRYP